MQNFLRCIVAAFSILILVSCSAPQPERTDYNAGNNASKVEDQIQPVATKTDTGQTSSTPLRTLKPHHVAISVPNFDETIRWYQEKLGFIVVNRRKFPDISTQAANLELNEFQVEIFTRDKSTAVREARRDPFVDDLLVQGVKHIAFTVDDLDAAVAELKRRGVQVASEPTVVNALGLRLCFIRDNNGYLIELGQELAQKPRK